MKPHLSNSLRTFYDGCERATAMCSIHGYLTSTAPASLNCDDILRSSIVLAVSSFDLLMHDIFRTEVLDRLNSGRKVDFFNIPFNISLLTDVEKSSLLEDHIRKENSYKSFVAPDKFAECLRPLLEKPWERVSEAYGSQDSVCKARLKGVVDLRNRIAHEADVNPAYGGIELWPIYSQDVQDSVAFLRTLGQAVAKAITNT